EPVRRILGPQSAGRETGKGGGEEVTRGKAGLVARLALAGNDRHAVAREQAQRLIGIDLERGEPAHRRSHGQTSGAGIRRVVSPSDVVTEGVPFEAELAISLIG